MKELKRTLATSALALSLVSATAGAQALPLSGSHPAVGAARGVEMADYRGGYRHHGGHFYGHRGHGVGAGAVIGGIVAGALIAGAIRESRADGSDISRCAETYRSFDARTGTYVGYDGDRHVCPYLE